MADEKSMMPELTLNPDQTGDIPQLTLDPVAPATPAMPAPEPAKPEVTPVQMDENLLNDAEKQAVEALSSVLWGFTSKECRDILERFFPKDE